MRIAAVPIDHPEVHSIQPTWHCLKRFRERHTIEPGTHAALDGLGEILRDADITTRPPRGVRNPGDWTLWAVRDRLAFPLVGEGQGRYVAPTCLAAGR